MSNLGTKSKPAVVKVQTEERAMEIMALCNAKGWQAIDFYDKNKTILG